MLNTLQEAIAWYKDEPSVHESIWKTFTENVDATPYLKAHRDYVEQGQFGYGDRPYHWLWKLLVEAQEPGFKFLEIGVFQGQVISLVRKIADMRGVACDIVGVTPLDTAGDQFATHPNYDYTARIKQIHKDHGVRAPIILKGMSFDPRIQLLAKDYAPYDIAYIDGCHDYHVVVDDIREYSPLLGVGGYLVIDDAGSYLNLPKGLIPLDWKGIVDVSIAVREELESNEAYRHVLSVGHIRVFRKEGV